MSLTVGPQEIFRGATIQLATTFFDFAGNITIPVAALMNLVYPNPDGTIGTAALPMTAPGVGSTVWTAQWDTRNVGFGRVSFSVHSVDAATPHSVEDGAFVLVANPANLQNFPP